MMHLMSTGYKHALGFISYYLQHNKRTFSINCFVEPNLDFL